MKINRSAVFSDAHARWRYARSKGWHLDAEDMWTWGRCLSLAWAAARQRRDEVSAYQTAPKHLRIDKPFPMGVCHEVSRDILNLHLGRVPGSQMVRRASAFA